MGVSQEYTMREGCVFFRVVGLVTRTGFEGSILLVYLVVSCIQIEWMRSIQIPDRKLDRYPGAKESLLPINWVANISRIDGQSHIFQESQLLYVLS